MGLTNTQSEIQPLVFRVLVQGMGPDPFLRRFTIEVQGFFNILDLIAEEMTRLGVIRWGILSVTEVGTAPRQHGVSARTGPHVRNARTLRPLHRDPAEVLIRPWGCFADGVEDSDALAAIKPGYVRWEETDLVFCQANVGAPDLRNALATLLDTGAPPWRLVLEYDLDDGENQRARLYYADDLESHEVGDFLSRHGIWTIGDGFVGVGVVSLSPFREVFVDSHGELLVWWDPDDEAGLMRFMGRLGLTRFESGELGFVSAQPHVHVEHEMTGAFEERLADLREQWGFYEFRDDAAETPEEEEEE